MAGVRLAPSHEVVLLRRRRRDARCGGGDGCGIVRCLAGHRLWLGQGVPLRRLSREGPRDRRRALPTIPQGRGSAAARLGGRSAGPRGGCEWGPCGAARGRRSARWLGRRRSSRHSSPWEAQSATSRADRLRAMNPVFADVLAANGQYAQRFGLSGLAPTAAKGLGIVTCMDSRIEPLAMLGLRPGRRQDPAQRRRTRDRRRSAHAHARDAPARRTRIMVIPHTAARWQACGRSRSSTRSAPRLEIDATSIDFGVVDGSAPRRSIRMSHASAIGRSWPHGSRLRVSSTTSTPACSTRCCDVEPSVWRRLVRLSGRGTLG